MSAATFRSEAMATHFEVVISGHPERYAGQAAQEAFRELARIEAELSRYVESSDISRVNRLRRGETILVGECAMECLLVAAAAAEDTGRAFDAAYASERAGGDERPGPAFTLDPSAHTVTSRSARLHVDLGAIGKGYALDRMAQVLADWEIRTACLNSGGSTALALDPPEGARGWPLGIGDSSSPGPHLFCRRALSGSGVAVKGSHLLDPRTGAPAARKLRAWACAPEAAVADALSTAFFVMTDEEVAVFCACHEAVGAVLAQPDGRMASYGHVSGP